MKMADFCGFSFSAGVDSASRLSLPDGQDRGLKPGKLPKIPMRD
jgi:hypothetical protein